MASARTTKATAKQVDAVLDAAANGQPIPSGFAYNPSYADEPVWAIHGAPHSDHLRPPSAQDGPSVQIGDETVVSNEPTK